MTYDSRPDTYAHITEVRGQLLACASDLLRRAHVHDASKLEAPEREAFDGATQRLKGLTYGSDDYRAALREMKPALAHHYAANDHHPEHFDSGVRGMHLLQFLEMVCDWRAASRRHADGDIRASVEHNAQRFGYGDDLKRLILNTIDELDRMEAASGGAL